MKIELTEKQIQLLYQLIIQVNWSGQQVEEAVELKRVFKKVIEKGLNEQDKPGE